MWMLHSGFRGAWHRPPNVSHWEGPRAQFPDGDVGWEKQTKRLGGGSAQLSSSFLRVLEEEAPVHSLGEPQDTRIWFYQLKKKPNISCTEPAPHLSPLHYCRSMLFNFGSQFFCLQCSLPECIFSESSISYFSGSYGYQVSSQLLGPSLSPFIYVLICCLWGDILMQSKLP